MHPEAWAGKTCVLTGATSGIGEALAAQLLARGLRLVLPVRDLERGEAARGRILEAAARLGAAAPAAPSLTRLDLALRASTRAAGAALRDQLEAVDLLVNNAGVWLPNRQQTEEGVERTWATNQLGPFHLTHELAPLLRAAPAARVLNLTSTMAWPLNVDDPEVKRLPYLGFLTYARSKTANQLFTWALQRRLGPLGISAAAAHPGVVRTAIASRHPGWIGRVGRALFGLVPRSPEASARTLAAQALDSPEAAFAGELFGPRGPMRKWHADPDLEDRLWTRCEQMCGIERWGEP